jgi:S-adenosylmethionine synthetase
MLHSIGFLSPAIRSLAGPSCCPSRRIVDAALMTTQLQRRVEQAVTFEVSDETPVARRSVEIVERKGLGHPDTMCDLAAEEISRALCQLYLKETGAVRHHNIENALLIAGTSTPMFRGGVVHRPMRFIYGDHAVSEVNGLPLQVQEVAEDAVRRWLSAYFPSVDPNRHIVFQSEVQPGSVQIADLFARAETGSNDTCVGCGFAPLTETEAAVFAAERFLNSPAFKAEFPQAGQDIKVTAVRRCQLLKVVVSLAFVDRYVADERAYFEMKEAITEALRRFLTERLKSIAELDISINTLDRQGGGTAGIYLTVLGTSADSADGGQVGRGNRANGLTCFSRPTSSGAVAGKNPVSNVGKIYNLLAHDIARSVAAKVEGIEEVHITLASQIGAALDDPLIAHARILPGPNGLSGDLANRVKDIVSDRLSTIDAYVQRLVLEGVPVC